MDVYHLQVAIKVVPRARVFGWSKVSKLCGHTMCLCWRGGSQVVVIAFCTFHVDVRSVVHNLSPVKCTINLWLGGTKIVVLLLYQEVLLPSSSLMLEDHKMF